MTRHRQDPDPVALALRDGRRTLVDPDVAQVLGDRPLSAAGGRGTGYAAVYRGGAFAYLHHCVVGVPLAGRVVDHRNGDPLDNRRRNLRIVTPQHNTWAQRPARGGTSEFRGVFRRRRARQRVWRALVRWCGRAHYVGLFSSAIEAALARDAFAMRLTGLREGLNFPLAIRRRDLGGFLRATNGRLFRVWFRKRTDGSVRSMLCRTGVRGRGVRSVPGRASRKRTPDGVTTNEDGAGGTGLAFEPSDRDLLSVYEFNTSAYRFVPLEGVLAVRFRRRAFRVIDPPGRGGSPGALGKPSGDPGTDDARERSQERRPSMPYLKSKPTPDRRTPGEAPPAPATLRHCSLGLFGDLVCPACGCQIVTPPTCSVVPGWGRCPRCHQRFRVLAATAKAANRRAAAVEARLAAAQV